jgi:hypothetical protein
VLEQQDARRIAESILSEDVTITSVRELAIGWAFYYEGSRYLETGDPGDMLVGNAPILVQRADGSIVPTGTGQPIEHYIERYERRREWRRRAPVLDVVVSDSLEALAEIGPDMLQPVRGRVEVRHPGVPSELIDQALAAATDIGERVLALTPDSTDWPQQAAHFVFTHDSEGDVILEPLPQDPHPLESVAATLEAEYPRVYPPVWEPLIRRAQYWWRWQI